MAKVDLLNKAELFARKIRFSTLWVMHIRKPGNKVT